MVSSSSPDQGDRRARLAAERGERPLPRRDAEVLDSRRSHRQASPGTGALELLSTGALKIINGHRRRAARKAQVSTAARTERRTRQAQLDRRGGTNRRPPPGSPTRRRAAEPAAATEALPDVSTQLVPGPATGSDGLTLFTASTGTDAGAVPAASFTPATGPSTSSTPRTDALRLEHLRTGSIPTLALASPSDAGRRRRAVTPDGRRRRLELAVGRAVSHRRVWGAVLAIVMVLLIPGTSVLSPKVTVADGSLSGDGGDLRAVNQFPDAVRAALPTAVARTTAAKAKAKARTKAKATAAAASKQKVKLVTRKAGLAPGSMAGLSDDASGLGWGSGVYIPGSSPSKVAAFAAWRGTGVDEATDWEATNSWSDITDPSWLFAAWKGTPYTKVFGVAPIPDGDPSATMAGCAAGDYNDKWTQFGKNFKAAGLDDETVIRLGWEFNGDWYKWSATDPAQFAECWRQIVGTVKQVAPKLTWDWNVNRGPGTSVVDARQAYPGDAYVDIVGIDSYDMWPGVTDQASWDDQYSGPYGLKFWADFADAHHKKFSVPEWGVYPGSASQGHNGGDNPYYIAKMAGFFKAEGSRLAFESYFDDNDSSYAGAIWGPTQNPVAAAKYKSLFGG